MNGNGNKMKEGTPGMGTGIKKKITYRPSGDLIIDWEAKRTGTGSKMKEGTANGNGKQNEERTRNGNLGKKLKIGPPPGTS